MGITRLAAALAISPAITRQARRDAAFARGDFRVCQPWYDGPAESTGRVLISVNEYRPHSIKDVVGIGRAAEALIRDEVLANPGAAGIMSAFGPRRRILYSLSVWRGEDALKEFTIAPAHREIMRLYRARGYLRHIHWWDAHRSIGASMLEATRRLDLGEGRRVGDARDPWARADQGRLAELGTTPAAPIWRAG
ncbi:hypothetical protein ACIOD2_45175 [Amycolatopsis sp. NPDC088138]|uniref:hypothetical protein n=1 Tax=Amycolatopsis sp. NPDC088138 TaxID=3363938 RepID=UPI0038205858